jgi:hypothetical protein
MGLIGRMGHIGRIEDGRLALQRLQLMAQREALKAPAPETQQPRHPG